MDEEYNSANGMNPIARCDAPFFEIPPLRLWAPTYVGHRNCVLGVEVNKEFDNPSVPILIQCVEGIRIVLGSHNGEDWHVPEIHIERRPKGWAIFLNPSAGDPCGYVYLLDDGRSFLVKESGPAAIELIDGPEDIPELDDVP
jgi:hypothetical protein